jgi:hypothetical protein
VFDQVMSTIIDALLAVPPIRFVMGLVESRWRPLWAAFWIAVIVYLISRTMNHLALRRARLKIVDEQVGGGAPRSRPSPGEVDHADVASVPPEPAVAAAAPADAPAPGPAAAESGRGLANVPVPILAAAALVVTAIALATIALTMRSAPNDSADTIATMAAAADSAARADGPMDIRWRSGRMDDDHCIGTFEVTHGDGTRARFVAFAMDSSGAIIARDSARVASAVTGMFVEFRFRHVDCDEIADWQIEATTPK